MSVDFATFMYTVKYVTDVRKPILIRGRHGIGKSEVVYQFAASVGLPVVERRASQMTEGDLLGLPSNGAHMIGGKRATMWDAPDWFLTACAEPVVLFIDEIDRATTEVRQGFFELTDSRKINGHILHPDTLIFAAVNGGEHGSQYQVNEMDPAELDRWAVFDVSPTIEDWLNWAKGNTHEVIWDFINQNRKDLEHSGDFEPNKVYPSRRSWKRLNDAIVKGNLLAKAQENANLIYNISTAFVGFEAAVKFKAHIANYKAQVTVEDILDSGNVDRTKDFSVVDHTALVDKIGASGRLKDILDDNVLMNLAAYFMMLPSEVAMKLFSDIGKQNTKNAISIHSKQINGTTFGAQLARILGANRPKQ